MTLTSMTQCNKISDLRGLDESDYLKSLFIAASGASSLGMAVMDSQTRVELVNASLACEMRIGPDEHIGKTTCELVGNVALPMEKVHEKVLSLGKPQSLLVAGRVRDSPEVGYWLNHCFPIKDGSGRVQKLGLFVVNVTAEKTSAAIFDALATDSKLLMAKAAGLLHKFDEAISHYQRSMTETFAQLGCPFTAGPRNVERFGASIRQIDEEIKTMRDLVYEVISHFSIGNS